MPLLTSVTVTVAPGITAPVGSDTVPTIEPNTTCAFDDCGLKKRGQTKRKKVTEVNVNLPLARTKNSTARAGCCNLKHFIGGTSIKQRCSAAAEKFVEM